MEVPKMDDDKHEYIIRRKGADNKYYNEEPLKYDYSTEEMDIDDFIDKRIRVAKGAQLEFCRLFLDKLRSMNN